MFTNLLQKIFGSRNGRTLKRMRAAVDKINSLEVSLALLQDSDFPARTQQLRDSVQQGQSLDKCLPEAFALVREAAKRTLGLRHFDVQLIGGMVLHEGDIAEMRTGEGKTLMSTLAIVLNALPGKGVHVVTINDYLAKRDAEWMGPIYDLLGLSVGIIYSDMDPEAKRAAYQADITYGTNNEFGFDYLRDNMAFSLEDKVQRELFYAIVDETDSILIDEARTPLIISGAAEDSSELYIKINQLMPKLNSDDFTLDEKQRQAHLTETGHQHVEVLLIEAGLLAEGESLYHASNIALMHHVNAALKAQHLFHKDVEYIVQNNEIVIVDEHTGRTMLGRRWAEGLHQAVEAKEGVKIQNENQTLASITFQNYFRMYDKLAGMTGTADTEAYEFQQIYGLDVVVIPTNKPMIRDDQPDLIYLNRQDKYAAIIEDIKDCIVREQPVLVGTASIEASEILSQLLNQAKIKHNVLNAKFHEKEAAIIAEAGRPGMVTIATNMAGRGTDIVLGGKPDEAGWDERHATVINAGGLRIIGSERHESRRIDNQLRGRAGRQGDAGSSRFYLSLEDNLMRIFASERVAGIMQKLGMEPGEAIEHKWVTRAIENAQRKVEGYNFDVRKQLLSYDDVANDQRRVIYHLRADIMAREDLAGMISELREDVLNSVVFNFMPPESLEEEWDVESLTQALKADFGLDVPIQAWLDADAQLDPQNIYDKVLKLAQEGYQAKEDLVSRDVLNQFEKSVLLQTLDNLWREHLANMDHLRQGIHLRGYAQKDPKQEYKREAFNLFTELLNSLHAEAISVLSTVEVEAQSDVDAVEAQRRGAAPVSMSYQHDETTAMAEPESGSSDDDKVVPFKREGPKVGRNQPCPCGSGKKYKQCHGQLL